MESNAGGTKSASDALLNAIASDVKQTAVYLSWIKAAEEREATSGWEVLKGKTFVEIAKANEYMVKNRDYHLAPIKWAKRYRSQLNFSSSYGICIEIDDGYPLNDFLELMKDFTGFVHTSNSHQKVKANGEPACDRYHAFLQFTRPITNVDDHRIVNLYLLKHVLPMADKQTYDGAHKFRCAANCQIHYLPGTKSLDVDRCLIEAHLLGIKSAVEKDLQFEAASLGSIKSEIKELVREVSIDQGWTEKTPHTYQKVMKALYAGAAVGHNIDDVAASVADLDWVQGYFKRKGIKQRDYLLWAGKAKVKAEKTAAVIKPIAAKLLEGRGSRVVLDGSTLQPVPQTVLDVYQRHPASTKLLNDKCGSTGKTDMMLTVEALYHLVQQKISGRFAGNCGVGKSKGMGTVICALATPENRFWLARKTCKEVRETAEEYVKVFGAPSSAVMTYHGFDRSCCVRANEFPNDDIFRDSKLTPCRKCTSVCPYGVRYHNEDWKESPIVITTHAMVFELYERGALPKDITVVFDEQIDRIVSFDVPADWHDKAIKTLRKTHEPCCRTHRKLIGVMRRTKGGIYRDWERNLVHVERLLHKQKRQLRKVKANRGFVIDRTERLERTDHRYLRMMNKIKERIKTAEMHNRINNWIRHQSIPARNMISTDASSVTMRKDRLMYADGRMGTKQIIALDGSAGLDVANWEALPEIVIDGLRPRKCSGTTVHVLAALPTKENAKNYKQTILDYTDNEVVPTRPCLITNAEAVQMELDWAEENDAVHIRMGQGVKGGNDGKDCTAVVVTSSLFTTVSDVAGVTAAANDTEIDGKTIWHASGKPRMNGWGFNDPALQETFLKKITDIAQQAAHRGRIRTDMAASFDVVLSLPSWRALAEFLRFVPASEVRWIPFPDRQTPMSMKIFTALWEEKGWMDLSDAKEIAKEVVGKKLSGHWTREVSEMLGVLEALTGRKID